MGKKRRRKHKKNKNKAHHMNNKQQEFQYHFIDKCTTCQKKTNGSKFCSLTCYDTYLKEPNKYNKEEVANYKFGEITTSPVPIKYNTDGFSEERLNILKYNYNNLQLGLIKLDNFITLYNTLKAEQQKASIIIKKANDIIIEAAKREAAKFKNNEKLSILDTIWPKPVKKLGF